MGQNTLTKTGHTFDNWNTAVDGNGTPYEPGTKFNMPGSNMTLYAQWTAVSTLYVCSDGNCGGNPNCHTTIESAVEAAGSGSIIKVANNITYSGDVTVSGKTLTIQGGWDTTFDNQSGTTTIQGSPTVPNGSLTMKQVNIIP